MLFYYVSSQKYSRSACSHFYRAIQNQSHKNGAIPTINPRKIHLSILIEEILSIIPDNYLSTGEIADHLIEYGWRSESKAELMPKISSYFAREREKNTRIEYRKGDGKTILYRLAQPTEDIA